MAGKKMGKVIQMINPDNFLRHKARELPIYECWINKDWQAEGRAIITVARKHDNGNITMGYFMVDVLCLGLFYAKLSLFNKTESEYRDILKKETSGDEMIWAEYDLVHNIIYASIEFADNYGFEPDGRFDASVQYLLKDDESDDVAFIEVECGIKDMPAYIFRPLEVTYSIVEAIKTQLDKTAGHGHYLIVNEDRKPIYGTELFDEDDEEAVIEDYDQADIEKSQTFQFKIQIKNINHPPVWRRVIVPSYYAFMHFHHIIQEVFGWTNSHLFQFSQSGFGYKPMITKIYEDLDYDESETVEAEELQLDEIFYKEKQKFNYIYDFGDHWEHQITLEKILPKVSLSPKCIAGKGACPPEDCGGPWGYEDLKKILADPKHEEYEEYAAWLGLEEDETWDPKEFDLADTQMMLEAVFGEDKENQ